MLLFVLDRCFSVKDFLFLWQIAKGFLRGRVLYEFIDQTMVLNTVNIKNWVYGILKTLSPSGGI